MKSRDMIPSISFWFRSPWKISWRFEKLHQQLLHVFLFDDGVLLALVVLLLSLSSLSRLLASFWYTLVPPPLYR